MRESDIVLVAIQQSDGLLKNRPAVILREMPPYRDKLVCGISSKLHQEVVGFDDLILHEDSDFAMSGLRTPSLIRLGFLNVFPERKLIGSIGRISSVRHRMLLQRLSDYLLVPKHDA
ncbi:MAG: transcriptional regulator [bacterium]|nr:transcriptional regulator [bacterium]